jgi:hypothetical protein
MWYNYLVTERRAFVLFAHIEPHPASVLFSVTDKMANVGCGFMFWRGDEKAIISTRKDTAYVRS